VSVFKRTLNPHHHIVSYRNKEILFMVTMFCCILPNWGCKAKT